MLISGRLCLALSLLFVTACTSTTTSSAELGISVTNVPAVAVADGNSRIAVNVAVKAPLGIPTGLPVVFSTDDDALSVLARDATLDANGAATAVFASSQVGEYVITISVGAALGFDLQSRHSIAFVAPMHERAAGVATLQLELSSPEAVADGQTWVQVVAKGQDANGAPLVGQALRLESRGDGAALDRLVASEGLLDASGTFTTQISSTTPGTRLLHAASGNLLAEASLRFVPGAPSNLLSSLAIPNRQAVADGQDSLLATVTVLDALGNAVPSQAVVVAPSSPTASVQPSAGFTDASGLFFTHVSSTASGAVGVSAALGNVTLSATASFAAGQGNLARSSLVLPSTPVVADGNQAANAVLVLRDAQGAALRSVPVVFSTNADPAAVHVTAEAPSTDANGTLRAAVTSSVVGPITLFATGANLTLSQATLFVAGPVSLARSLLEVSAGPLLADGVTTATVQIALVDAFGHAIEQAPVALSATLPGISFAPAAGVTDAAGRFGAALTARRSGTATLMAGVPGASLVANVTLMPGAPYAASSQLTASPLSVSADGHSSALVSLVVRDALGNAEPNITVAFDTDQTHAQLAPSGGVTDANGTLNVALSSTEAGLVTISTTLAGARLTTQTTFVPAPPDAGASSLTVSPNAPLVADGVGASTASLILRDAFGNPASAQAVTWSSASPLDSVTPAMSITDGNGRAQTQWRGTQAGPHRLLARAGSVVLQADLPFVAGPPASSSTLVITPTSPVIADGVAQAIIAVQATDAFGNAVAGANVSLLSWGLSDTLSPVGGPTDANGYFVASWSSTRAEKKTLRATLGEGAPVVLNATGTFVPGAVDAAHSNLSVVPATLIAGGAASVVTLSARDAYNNVLPNVAATFASGGNSLTLLPSAGVTGDEGQLLATLSGTRAGWQQVVASLGNTSVAANVLVQPGAVSASASSLHVEPQVLLADATQAATVTLALLDATLNPVADQNVSFAAIPSLNATFSSVSGRTDANGLVAVSVQGAQAGVTSLVASLGALTWTAPLTFVAGPPAESTSKLTLTPNAVTADGRSAARARLVVRDASGNPVANRAVALGVQGNQVALVLPPGQVTDGDGQLQATLTATLAQQANVTADLGGNVVLLAPLRFDAGGASAAASAFVASPNASVVADGLSQSVLQLTVRDALGNPIAGRSVALTCSSATGVLGQPTVLLDATGQATTTLSTTSAGPLSVTAVIDGASLRSSVSFVAGPPDANQSYLGISPSSVIDDGTSSASVFVQAADAFGNLVSGAPVTLTASGANVILSPNAGVTAGDGTFLANVAATVAEAKSVTATVGGLVLVADVNFVVGLPDTTTISFVATPNAVVADSVDSSALQLSVRDFSGQAIAGANVQISLAGAAASLSATTGVTDANGQWATSLTGQSLGVARVTAHVMDVDVLALVSLLAGQPNLSLSSVTALPPLAIADGNAAIGLTVRLLDDSGHAIANRSGTWSSSNAGDAFEFLSSTTSSLGLASNWLRSTQAGNDVVTLATSAGNLVVPVRFVAGGARAETSSLVAAPSPVTADGNAASTVSLRLEDAFGNPVSGAACTLTSSSGNVVFGPASNANVYTATSDANGWVSTQARSRFARAEQLVAQAPGLSLSAPLVFVAGAPDAARSSLTPLAGAPMADGVSQAQVVLRLIDALDNPVSQDAVTALIPSGTATPTPAAGQTDGNGRLLLSLVSRVAGVAPVLVQEAMGSLTLSANVRFAPGNPNVSTSLWAPDANAVAVGPGHGAAMTLSVFDAFGNAVPGVSVVVGIGGAGGVATPPSGVSDANGRFVSTISAPIAEDKLITAYFAGGQRSQTVTFVAGAADANASALSTSPLQPVADNVSPMQLIAAVRDAFGNAVAGYSVSFASNDANDIFAAPSAVSDASGAAIVTMRASRAGLHTFVARVGSGNVILSTPFGAGAVSSAVSTLSVSPPVVVADGSAQGIVRVTVLDALHNPVAGQTVSLSVSGGNNALGRAVGTSDVNGVFATVLSSTLAEAKTLSATVGGVSWSSAATFVSGPPAYATSILTANPLSVTANGSSVTTLVATLRDAFANPCGNVVGTFSATGSSNVFGQASGVTDATGSLVTTLSSTVAESKTAQVQSGTVTRALNLLFLPGAADSTNSALVLTPNAQVADGNSSMALSIVARDARGNAIGGQPISLSASPATVRFVPSAGQTNAAGVFLANASATVSGNVLLSATIGSTSVTQKAVFFAGAANANTSSVTISPSQLAANGNTAATITVVAADAFGNRIANQAIALSISGGNNLLGNAAGVTDATGTWVTTLRSVRAENKVVTAEVGTIVVSAPVNFVGGGASSQASSFLVQGPNATTVADGVQVVTLLLSARDAQGNPLANQTAVFSASGSSNAASATGVVTDSNGAATFTLSSRRAELKTIQATIGGATLSTSASFVAGPIAQSHCSVVLTPNVILADGNSTSSLGLHLADAFDNPVGNVAVALASSGSNTTLSPTVVMTDAAGSASASLCARRAELKVITASWPGGSVSASALFVPGPVNNQGSSLLVSPNQVTADGVSQATLSVSLADVLGNPVTFERVSFAASGAGLFSSPNAITDAAGKANVTIASTLAGPRTLTAQAQGTSLSGNIVFLPGPPSTLTSSFAASPNVVTADGASGTTLLLTVRDAFGNAVPTTPVVLSASSGSNVFGQASGTTTSAGVYVTSLRSTSSGTRTLTASVSGTAINTVVSFAAGAPSAAASSFTASPSQVLADGQQPMTLSLALRDAQNNAIANAPVALSVSGSNNTLSQPVGVTDGSGSFVTSLFSTRAQSAVATVTSGALSLTAPCLFVAGAPTTQSVVLTASPNHIVADGNSSSRLSLLVADSLGNPVAGSNASFSSTGTAVTLLPVSGTTDGNGLLTAQLTGTQAGSALITASLGAISVSTPVSLASSSPSAAQSTLTLTPQTVTADGNSVVAISLLVRDAQANAASGQPVVFSSTGSNNTIVTPSLFTDDAGSALTSLRSSVAESKRITASFAGQSLSGNVTFVAGATSNATSTFVASPNVVVADGVAATTLTLTARDALGNRASLRPAAFSSTGSTNVLSALSATTDGNGVATIAARSTVAESKSFVVTLDGTSFAASAQFVAGAPDQNATFLTASPNPGMADGGSPVLLTLSALDAFGNGCGSQPVAWSSTGSLNVLSSPNTLTDAAGFASVLLRSRKAEPKTISAQIGSVTKSLAVSFTGGPINANVSALTLSPNVAVADTNAPITLSVFVADTYGNPLGNVAVGIAVTGSNNTLDANAGLTDATGLFATALRSSKAESKVVVASASGIRWTTSATFVAGSPNLARSSMAASPNAGLLADGLATAFLTASVADAFGNPISNQNVSVGVSGTGGVLQASSGTTTGAGGFATGLSSTKAETKTVTLTAGALSLSVPVAFSAGPASTATSVLVANPATGVLADGNASSTLTAQVNDAYGNPVANQTVSLASTGVGHVFGAGSGVTDANGTWTSVVRSTRAQAKTVSLLAGAASASTSVTFVAASPNGSLMTLVASPGSGTVANNVAAVTVIGLVTDAFGNPVTNYGVGLASSGSNNAFASSGGNTDGTGTFLTTLRSSTAESKVVTFTAGSATATATTSFVAGSPNASMSTLSASPNAAIVADGASVANVVAVVRDAFGNPVTGQSVTLASSDGNDWLAPKRGITDGNGTFVATVSTPRAASKTLTLTAGTASLVTSVTFVAGAPSSNQTSLLASPSSNIVANNSNTATLTATVLDAQNNPVQGQNVSFTCSNANDTFAAATGATDAAGHYTTTLRSKKAQNKVVTLTAGSASAVASVGFVAGSANMSLSALTLAPSGAVTADGNTFTQVSLALVDDYGNPLFGRAVTLSSSSPNDVFGNASGTTNSAGLFATTLSSTKAETKTITATSSPYVLSSNVTFVAGPLNAALSSFVASPSSGIVANNASASSLMVMLRDANSNAIANQNLTLSSSNLSDTLGASSGASDANGNFVTTLRTAQAGVRTVSLLAGSYSPAIAVTFVAGPAASSNSTFVASPNAGIVADATSSSVITVSLADAFGNPVVGQTVALTPSNANDVLSSAMGSTDANGQFVSTLKSKKAETKRVAVAAGPLNANIAVSFVAGSPNQVNSSFLASPTSNITADNNSSSSLSAHLGDAFGNPVTNFNVSLSASGTNNFFGVTSGATDASGGFVTTLKSTTAQSKVVTLTAGPLSPNAPVLFVAGAPNATLSSLTISPNATVVANGSFAATVSLSASDVFSNAVTNQNVTFSCSPNCSVSTSVVATNAAGLASTQVASSLAGSGNVVATLGAMSKALPVTFVSATTPASLTLSPNSITAGGNVLVSVSLVTSDANGMLLPNQAYRLASPVAGVAFSSVQGISDANGRAVNSLKSFYAGNQPIKAIFGSNLLNATLSVSAMTALCPNSAPHLGVQPWLYNSSWSPRRLVLTDLTGDGRPDVAFTSQTATAFFVVLVNNGNGLFPTATQVSATGTQYGIAAADVTGDGYVDLITTSNSLGSITVFAGAGNGNFSSLKTLSVGSSPWDIVAADFDGDALPDLAVTNAGSSNVSLLWNNGNANFQLASLTTDSTPHGLAHGFLDSDTKRDLVVACASTAGAGINVFLNQGSRSFAGRASYLAGVSANAVSVGDLNGDGYGDLAVSALQANGLLTYLCNSAGTCSLNGNYRTKSASPTAVSLYDVNGDGNLDVLQAQGSFNRTYMFMGSGAGSLQTPTFLAGGTSTVQDAGVFVPGNANGSVLVELNAGGSVSFVGDLSNYGLRKQSVSAGPGSLFPRDFAVADFNGDGAPDVFVLNFYNPSPLYLGVSGGNLSFPSSPSLTFTVTGNGTAARAGDINGDGALDIVSATSSNSLDAFVNLGNANFASRKSTSIASTVVDMQVVDWDNDGYADVVNTTSTGVGVFKSNGNGNFTSVASGTTSGTPTRLAIADFDQDGALDVALVGGDSNLFVFYGKGDGTISRTYTFSLSATGLSVAAIDLNGDGLTDLAAFMTNTTASMLLNQGNATFSLKQTLPSAGQARNVEIADFTGDGRPDLLTIAMGEYTIGAFASNGDGTVSAPQRFTGPVGDFVRLHTYTQPSTGKPIIFAAGDLDLAVVYMQSSGCL